MERRLKSRGESVNDADFVVPSAEMIDQVK